MADGGREAHDVRVASGPKRHECIFPTTKGRIVAARVGVILATPYQSLIHHGRVIHELSSLIMMEKRHLRLNLNRLPDIVGGFANTLFNSGETRADALD